jgi:hypothetical protein
MDYVWLDSSEQLGQLHIVFDLEPKEGVDCFDQSDFSELVLEELQDLVGSLVDERKF